MLEIKKKIGPNYFIWHAMNSAFSEFIQNMYQAPSMCLFKWIKVDQLDFSKSNRNIQKILFA
jgi:hypothetical protein